MFNNIFFYILTMCLFCRFRSRTTTNPGPRPEVTRPKIIWSTITGRRPRKTITIIHGTRARSAAWCRRRWKRLGPRLGEIIITATYSSHRRPRLRRRRAQTITRDDPPLTVTKTAAADVVHRVTGGDTRVRRTAGRRVCR